MKKILILTIAFVAFLGVQYAKAWHNFAHGTIAYIAEQHLTPEAKAKCHHYLRHTLPSYASWMDSWKGAEKFIFVNKSHGGRAMDDNVNYDFKSGEPEGGVMGYLVLALEELGNGKYKSLPDSVVRQRIINMVHYVPDMHCPSHVNLPESVYPIQREHKLFDNGKKLSYHRYWDHSLGMQGRKNWNYEKIAAQIDVCTQREIKAIQSGTLEDWGRDIVKLANRSRRITPVGIDVAHMSYEQKDDAMKLANDAAQMGAYRLAHVLNTIFSE